ncbi:MAG: glycerol-3-phosphate 1-O-acyltransferase PlsY [Lachnospiraceae bacterium]|nr:glycerol-3-phosphate 1-O-acyltransferase PlsY [Lachnospiraceae bacterium]
MGAFGLRVLCLVIGYAFGMIQTAYILGKMNGIDIRDYGSGNAGTTNAMRVLGPKAGLTVFFGDMFKSLVALLLVGALFGGSHPELVYVLKAWTFAGVVLGHDFPFYMNFKGGKGVAVMAGFVFGFYWPLAIAAVLVFFIPYLTTRFVSLGSLMVYGCTYILLIIFGQMGRLGATSQMHLIEIYVIQGLLTFMAFYRHRANIGRLLRGEERKTYIFKKNTERLEK